MVGSQHTDSRMRISVADKNSASVNGVTINRKTVKQVIHHRKIVEKLSSK